MKEFDDTNKNEDFILEYEVKIGHKLRAKEKKILSQMLDALKKKVNT